MSADSLGDSPHFLDLVTAIALRLYKDPDLESILSTIVQELHTLLHVKRVLIVQIYPDHTAKVVAECSDCSELASPINTFKFSGCIQSWTQKLLITHVIHDRNQDSLSPCKKQLLNWLAVDTGILAPIYLPSDRTDEDQESLLERGQHLWGFLVVDHDPGTRGWSPIEVSFVERLAMGCLGVVQNISQMKQIQQQLEQSRLAAEAANLAKSNFLATMSHEIRTPLNAVIGLAELLASTPLNGEQQEYIDIIRNSSAMLLSLINDILDISKIEAQKLDLEQQPFDLHHCVNDTLKLLAPLAAEKNLVMRSHISSDVPQYVVGDTMRLRQILVNLINNAIKFTHQGCIDVQVSCQEIPSPLNNEVELYFTVQDTGVGIPIERQAQLFEAFQQLDASVTRRYGGTGLGLAICKSLVEAMGGQITVESEPGQGSTFAFTIQVPAIAPTPAPSTPLTDQPLSSERSIPSAAALPKILVVDDLTVNQKVAVKMLENLGYAADRARDGREAIAALRQTPYDVVLMDIQMPEMDGYEATRTIRAMPSTLPQPWIIAMTAHSQVEDRQHCLQVGMNDYLSKPILPKDLTAALHRYNQSLPVPTVQPSPAIQPTPSPLLPPLLPVSLLDDAVLEDLCDLVGPDRDLIADLLQSYRQESQSHLNELRTAIQQGNGDLIGRYAHGLRSMSLNLGAIALADLCRDLEMNHSQQSQTQQFAQCQRIASLLSSP